VAKIFDVRMKCRALWTPYYMLEETLDGNGQQERLQDGDLERLQDCDGSVASTAGISMKFELMAVPMDLNGEENPS